MAFKNDDSLKLISILCLYFTYSFSADPSPDSIVVPNEWELVKSGWPIEDVFDTHYGKRTQFFYMQNKSKVLNWKLKPSFIEQFKNTSQYFKLSFKYWSHSDGFEPETLAIINDVKDSISNRYKSGYIGDWMSCEFIMSYQNLSDFDIRINPGDKAIIAFKDFKIEYELQIEKSKNFFEEKRHYFADEQPQEIEEVSLHQWNKYSSPPPIPSDEVQDFLFFSNDCINGCLIRSDGIKFLDKNLKEESKFELKFKYWIEGKDTNISLSGTPLSTSSKWSDLSINITNIKHDKLVITVKTAKNKYNEKSFVAIRDLTIHVYYTMNGNKDSEEKDEFKCINAADCVWNIAQTFLWSKPREHFTENAIYYYPISKTNSFKTARSNDINEDNVCFTIEYWASYGKDIKINVNYNVKHETVEETLFSIKPKLSKIDRYLETTKFCLRELIALNAKEYLISFNIEQYDYSDGINGFALRIEDLSKAHEKWGFENKKQKFLNTMTKPYDDKEGNLQKWDHEWDPLSPDTKGLFEEKDDFIQFSAIAESRNPVSAQLNSLWIEYDPNLHLVDPQYSVKVLDKKLFNAFIIKPKVCDSLSHCSDVIQKIENSNETLRVYSFKFSPIKFSRYIKLRFYIEYFQPPHEINEVKVDFELRLLHFGDPCFTTTQCKTNDRCVSDEFTDTPNKPYCSCPSSKTGMFCELNDFCNMANYKNTGKSGKKLCEAKGLQCETLAKDLRCLCDEKQEHIIWDTNTQNCVELKHPDEQNWVSSENNFHPNDNDNSLIYSFSNINTEKYDVCLQLQYKSNQIVQLNVVYKFKNEESILFNTSLLEAQSDIEFKFCVRDFRYNVNEEFSLALQVSGIEGNWNQSSFSLISFKPSVQSIKEKSIPFIYNWDFWDQTLGVNPASNQKWIIIPNQLFNKSNDNESPLSITFKAKLNSRKKSKALLISDWITNSTNFIHSDNFYAIKFKRGTLNKLFRIVVKIVYQEKENIKVIESNGQNMNFKDIENYSISENNKISIPNSIKTPFKIIFEITYSLSGGEKETELDITFQNLSIGDPCFINKQNVCHNNGKCIGSGPNNYVCNCTDQSFGGIHCEYHNICSNKFDKLSITNDEYCSSLPSLPDSKEKKCITLTNTTFECKCPQNDYFWSQNEKRCVRNGYLKKSSLCEGKNCEFFDTILSDTKWSNKNIPIIKSLNDPILPFYYPSVNNAKLNIHVNNLDNKHDACLEFYYKISGNSSLEISYENFKTISLTPTQANGIIDWFPSRIGEGELLCARSLVKNIDMDFNIVFSAKVSNIENEMIALRFKKQINTDLDKSYISFIDRDLKLSTELPFLTHWSTIGLNDSFKADNQWPIALPKRYWTLNSDDSITFEATPTPIKQTAYLISNWLLKNIDGYKLRFNISSRTHFKNFIIQTIIFDDKMQQKQVSDVIIGDKSLNTRAQESITNTVLISINKMITSFRVAIKVDYILLTKNLNAEFKLKAIDLGDPCIFDNTTHNWCSGRGICIRNGAVNDYNCVCDEGFTDKNCQTVDYCALDHEIMPRTKMNGTQFCKEQNAGNCLNRRNIGFSCSCTPTTFWNFNQYQCQDIPKCIAKKCDLQTEECVEPIDAKKEAVCVCKNNYVNISIPYSGKCQKYDPCNELHRNITNQSSGKPCGTSNAKCISIEDNTDEYVCVCPEGFQNIGDKTSTKCEPVFCSFPSLNPCQQFCNIDETDSRKFKCMCSDMYDLSVNNCRLKSNKTCSCRGESFCNNGPEDCICKMGYKLAYDINGKNNGCQPDLEYSVSKTVCPNGELNVTTNNKLSCNCGQYFRINDRNTCDLKPICGKEGVGRIDCDSRDAKCITNKNNIGDYECLCPYGKIFDDQNSINKTCIDKCLYRDRYRICLNINAKCDPTRISSDNDKVEQYCVCNPGYFWNSIRSICVIAKYTAEFSLTIKNTFYDTNNHKSIIGSSKTPSLVRSKRQTESKFISDLSGFANELKSMNEENNKIVKKVQNELQPQSFANALIDVLKPIIEMTSFGEAKDRITIKKCNITSNDVYVCVLTIALKKPLRSYGKLNEELTDKTMCIPYPEEPGNCFFQQLNSSQSLSKQYSLVINNNILAKNNLVNYKPCEASITENSCPEYTTCIEDPDPDSTLYSCVCNNDYFTNQRKDFIPTEDSVRDPKAVKYICKVKDLCATNCPKQHGNCLQSIPHRNNTKYWIAPYYCSCHDNYNLSKDNKSCSRVCDGIQCNHGKCVSKGSFDVCQCDEGWSGQRCDHEYKPVIGGWVTGIVVLSILLIVSIAFFAIIVIRIKRSDSGSDSDDHGMVDYMSTSYRVGQSDGGLVRVQSIGHRQYQDTDNQAFHREREIN